MSVQITKQLLNQELSIVGVDETGKVKIAGAFNENANWKVIYDCERYTGFNNMSEAVNFAETLIRKEFQ